MKKVAIIPLRKGSKGIIGKNKRKLLGRPLFQWVLTEAIFSDLDVIYVFTDDDEIYQVVENEYKWTNKVKGMRRSAINSSDTSTTESAMIEFANNIDYDFDMICLLQATSPLTNRNDINLCIQKIVNEGFDSVLTVTESKRFIWSENGSSINYKYLNRPRRQDFNGLLIENGAIYIATKEIFLSQMNRLGGKIGLVKMSEDTLIEIDEQVDWPVVEQLAITRLKSFKKNPDYIQAMVFDVDGVFTDGTVGVSSSQELFKIFSLRDGMGFEILSEMGITPIVLTSEESPIVKVRMKKLNINNLYTGVKDKYTRLDGILKELNLKRNQIAYLGDDINDLANILSSGWGIAPSNAVDSVKIHADLVLNKPGGYLAIREAIEFVIKYNQKF